MNRRWPDLSNRRVDSGGLVFLVSCFLAVGIVPAVQDRPALTPPAPDGVRPIDVESAEYSGPQVGEPLPDFSLLSLTTDSADPLLLPKSPQRPQLVVFAHEITRPAMALIRTLNAFRAANSDRLDAALVVLTEDLTKTREWAQLASRALPTEFVLATSAEGREGPGALGLNRKMTLTILIVRDQIVTANFALVQPSDQADALKICQAWAQAAGLPEPDEKAITQLRGPQSEMRRDSSDEVNLRPLLGPVIRKTSSADEIDLAAQKVEVEAAANAAFRKRLAQACQAIVDNGKLENYGNETSQKWLKQWAEKYRDD